MRHRQSAATSLAGFVLAIVVVTAPPAAAQSPLARAVETEARRLAAPGGQTPRGQTPKASGDWWRVTRVPSGASVTITTSSQTARRRATFVRADDRGIVAIDSTPLGRAGAQLVDFAVQHPSVMVDARTELAIGDVKVDPSGAYVDGRKVAERDVVVLSIARDDVLELIESRVEAGRRLRAGVRGGLVGLLVGPIVGGRLTVNCGCADRDLAALGGMMVGAPVGAAALGTYAAYRIKPHDVVVYRKP